MLSPTSFLSPPSLLGGKSGPCVSRVAEPSLRLSLPPILSIVTITQPSGSPGRDVLCTQQVVVMRLGLEWLWPGRGPAVGLFYRTQGQCLEPPLYPTSSQSTHMHTNTRTRAHTTHTTHTRNTHHTQAHITIHTSHTPHTTHVTHTCTHTSHTCTCTHTHPTHAHTPLTHRTRNTPHTHHTHAHTHPACFLGALLLGFLGWRLIREFSPKLECRGLSCSPWEGPRFSHWVLGS